MNDRFKFRVWDKPLEKYMEFKEFKFMNVEFTFNPTTKEAEIEYDKERYIVEQCTGLKDKNGKLIYDGDIVEKIDTNALGLIRVRTCRVFWHTKWLAWAIETEYGDVYMLHEYDYNQYEVIGNIHEDTELLKESK